MTKLYYNAVRFFDSFSRVLHNFFAEINLLDSQGNPAAYILILKTCTGLFLTYILHLVSAFFLGKSNHKGGYPRRSFIMSRLVKQEVCECPQKA